MPNYRDGPSNTLLRVIKEEPYLRNNWKGFRELTEKWYSTSFFFIKYKMLYKKIESQIILQHEEFNLGTGLLSTFIPYYPGVQQA